MVSGAISSEEGQAMLRKYVKRTSSPSVYLEHDVLKTCPSAILGARTRLQSRLDCILLSSALRCSRAEDEAFRSTLLPLLQSSVRPPQPTASCTSHDARTRNAPVSLLEAGSTPLSVSISHGWKDNIANEMSRDAHRRPDSVIRMVGEICRDLELRCDEAERPLREEQSRSRNLETKLEASGTRIGELEADVEHCSFQVKDLEFEKASLREQVRSSENRLQDLSSNLDKTHEELQHAKGEAQRSTETAAESARQQDLAYLATLTGKDEMYEEQASRLATSEHQVHDLEIALAELQSREIETAGRAHAGGIVIEELKKTNLELRTLEESKEAEIGHLIESETKLIITISEVTKQAKQATNDYDDNVAELRSQIEATQATTARLREEHRTRTAENTAAFARLEEQNQITVNSIQAENQRIRSDATQALEVRDHTIAELQRKVSELRQERQARTREFAEAQDLSSKLMAVVGMKQPRVASPTNKVRPSRSGDITSDDEFGLRGFHDAKHARSGGSTSAISSSHGSPTPKRTRIQRSLTSPLISSCKDIKLGHKENRQSVTRINRFPLMPLVEAGATVKWRSLAPRQSNVAEKNLSPCRIASGSLDENAQTQHRLEFDESFADADIFTSTNQQQLLGAHNPEPCSTYDETTAEY